jgi:hypothetical protein
VETEAAKVMKKDRAKPGYKADEDVVEGPFTG